MPVDVYSSDGVTLAATIDTPNNSMMVIWGTRVFMLDVTSGDYVETAGSPPQAVTLPALVGIGATDGWQGWDKV